MFLNLILATLFHKSSMVFFILLPLSQIGLKKYHYLSLTVLFSFFLLNVDYQRLIVIFSEIFNARYLLLLTASLDKTAALGLGLLLKIVYPIAFILTLPKNRQNIDKEMKVSANFGMYYIVLSFLVLKIDIFNRLRDVIWVGLLFSITAIPKSKYRKLISYFVIFSGIALYYIMIKNSSTPGSKLLAPYRSIFN